MHKLSTQRLQWFAPDGRPGVLSVALFWLLNLLTVGCVALGVGAVRDVPRLGFTWKANGTNLVITVIDPSGPAANTALSSGDHLLAMNDITLHPDDALIYPEINNRNMEQAWWQQQNRLYLAVRDGNPVTLEVQKKNRRAKVTITPASLPLRDILSSQSPLYMNAALHILLGWLVFGRARSLAQLLCAFLSVFMALNYIAFVPLTVRNPGLPLEAMHWLVLAFYVAAGGNITLIHFSLIFPTPKGFLLRWPGLGLIPYVYFVLSVILYASGIIAFGSTFPFLVGWVALMIGALIHTMFSQSDRFLRQQSLLAALAPLYVGLFYVLLTLLPTVMRDSANDYALYASVTLILPFTLAFAAETTALYAAMQREDALVQAERLRISRDLHDSVGGDLTAIKLFAEEMEAESPTLPPAAKGLIGSIRDTAMRSLAQVRGFIWAIDPRECNWPAFAQRLQRTGENLFKPLGITFSFSADPRSGPAVYPHILYQISGIYQETLNNILKHAQATSVVVRFDLGPTEVRLVVRDDGNGQASEPSGEGYGSRSMRERAASIGAQLTRGPAPSRGTEVILQLTVDPPGVAASR